jgi:hypothetical protein
LFKVIFSGGVLGFWGGIGSLDTVFLLVLFTRKFCCRKKKGEEEDEETGWRDNINRYSLNIYF